MKSPRTSLLTLRVSFTAYSDAKARRALRFGREKNATASWAPPRGHVSRLRECYHANVMSQPSTIRKLRQIKLCHEPHCTDVVFDRRRRIFDRRKTSLTQVANQFGMSTFKLVKP
ncbi:hypothetical protein EVAR_12251_1 [Eumeta japonica]|uniref:Uncharacterized protein n=1 Tax=Eumeta variegata TaxID=151549 RepID=A0A4C1TU64_EUMVA|nr:hypothetical protein EVAR_12251_1 [Eumeta japonica]